MTYARKNPISRQDTPYYHLIGRCVRRSWLCGFDRYSGRDYSHRKQWVLERLRHLTSMCAINVCAYAILSNIDVDAWQLAMRPSGNVFGRAMGRLDHLRLHAKTLGQSWVRGLRQAERLYSA